MLLVDTCGSAGGVAVADLVPGNGPADAAPRLVAERVLPGRETQERLMSAIGDVLQQCSLQPEHLHVIAVVTGPGSFTGVRIGLAAVKGLAEALSKPVVAVSRLAVLAAQAGTTGEVQAWIDAGRGDVFAGRYRDGLCLCEAMMHGEDAVSRLGERTPVIVMEERLALLHSSAHRVPEVGLSEALPLTASAAAAGHFGDSALLDANYLRVPDAELARQAKLGAIASAPGTAG